MHDFEDDDALDEDGDELSVEALVWRLLLLINPGDEETALRQFAAYRDVAADRGGAGDPVERVGEVIDWCAGFRADDPRTLAQALDELASRWNLAIDWDVDLDDDEEPDGTDAPALLSVAYDRLAEHGYTVWLRETPDGAYAGWITRTDDAEPMRELATALHINLRLACDAS